MERIHLTKDEKNVLRHVAEKGGEGPWELPMLQVKCALYLLEQKGLIYYILNFDEAVDATALIIISNQDTGFYGK